jgi:hypothetical protein
MDRLGKVLNIIGCEIDDKPRSGGDARENLNIQGDFLVGCVAALEIVDGAGHRSINDYRRWPVRAVTSGRKIRGPIAAPQGDDPDALPGGVSILRNAI